MTFREYEFLFLWIALLIVGKKHFNHTLSIPARSPLSLCGIYRYDSTCLGWKRSQDAYSRRRDTCVALFDARVERRPGMGDAGQRHRRPPRPGRAEVDQGRLRLSAQFDRCQDHSKRRSEDRCAVGRQDRSGEGRNEPDALGFVEPSPNRSGFKHRIKQVEKNVLSIVHWKESFSTCNVWLLEK